MNSKCEKKKSRKETTFFSRLYHEFLCLQRVKSFACTQGNGILLPKLLRKNCSSDRDFFLKLEAEGQ